LSLLKSPQLLTTYDKKTNGEGVMGLDFVAICNATLTTPSQLTIGWRASVVTGHVLIHLFTR
jgi:hypothetical protein